jgi:arginase family enzyme
VGEFFKDQVVFLGCPLDCDEQLASIEEKRAWSPAPGMVNDPLEAVLALIRDDVPAPRWASLGSLTVPSWLWPLPPAAKKGGVTSAAMVDFIDSDGCREFADQIHRLVAQDVFPAIPCLVAVDHCLAGGPIRAVAERVGSRALTVVILDSHTDAVPMPVLAGAIAYDMATNPSSVYDRSDPLLYNRPDSYNASSFLHHLIAEDVLSPENLYLVGIGDLPDKRVARIEDPRIEGYVGVYKELKSLGAKLITKKDCLLKPSKVKALLTKIKTPYLYISIDLDIGARNASEGVRFLNRQGLDARQILRLALHLAVAIAAGAQLAGIDVTEFNGRKAGGTDPTYRIAADLIKILAFNIRPQAMGR